MDEKRLVKLLWVVKAGLLAVLVYTGFEVVVSLLRLGVVLDPSTASGEPRTTETSVASSADDSPPDYNVIAQRNLFAGADKAGAAPTGAPVAETPDSPAATEELGLSLIGTLAGGPTASRAILQESRTNKTDSYRIGDSVAAATVEAIQRETVVLRYQGRLVVLKQCPGKAEGKEPKPREGGPKIEAAGPAGAGRSQPAAAPEAPRFAGRSGSMAEVFRQATIEPYVKNSRTEGLKITGLEKIPLAERLGLQNGDVVQAINGQQLTSKQKAFQVLMKARTQSKVDIQLLRDGRRKGLSFDL